MTLRERYIAYFTAQGYVQVPSKSNKYVVYHKDGARYYHIGVKGSVRSSTTGLITESHSMADSTRQAMVQWENSK